MAPASFVACLENCVLKIAHDLMIYRSVLLGRNFACDVMKSMLRVEMDFIHRIIATESHPTSRCENSGAEPGIAVET